MTQKKPLAGSPYSRSEEDVWKEFSPPSLPEDWRLLHTFRNGAAYLSPKGAVVALSANVDTNGWWLNGTFRFPNSIVDLNQVHEAQYVLVGHGREVSYDIPHARLLPQGIRVRCRVGPSLTS